MSIAMDTSPDCQPRAPQDDKCIRDEAVAKMMDVSRRQVWRWLSAGQIPKPIRIGSSVRWRQSEIQAWLAAGCPNQKAWESMQKAG